MSSLQLTQLDRLYSRFTRLEYVHPDPLEFLYNYHGMPDREIAGLVASSLAYGRVAQILASVGNVLDRLGNSPCEYVRTVTPRSLRRNMAGFKHRFTDEDGIVSLLLGARKVLREYGSLNECVAAGTGKDDIDVLPGLAKLVSELACEDTYLVPLPERGSACKRLNLFLRWMVRKDRVDPGGWRGIPTGKLIVPLDTHMASIGRMLRLTARNTADMKMAREITGSLRKYCPDDPVKYDFCLTRFGIRTELCKADLPELLMNGANTRRRS